MSFISMYLHFCKIILILARFCFWQPRGMGESYFIGIWHGWHAWLTSFGDWCHVVKSVCACILDRVCLFLLLCGFVIYLFSFLLVVSSVKISAARCHGHAAGPKIYQNECVLAISINIFIFFIKLWRVGGRGGCCALVTSVKPFASAEICPLILSLPSDLMLSDQNIFDFFLQFADQFGWQGELRRGLNVTLSDMSFYSRIWYFFSNVVTEILIFKQYKL